MGVVVGEIITVAEGKGGLDGVAVASITAGEGADACWAVVSLEVSAVVVS